MGSENLRQVIRMLVESSRTDKILYNRLKKYANVDIPSGERASIPNSMAIAIRQAMKEGSTTFIPYVPNREKNLYRGMSMTLKQFERTFSAEKRTSEINPYATNELNKEIIIIHDHVTKPFKGRIVSSWTWSPVIASEFAAGAGGDTFDGYEVVLSAVVQEQDPHTFLDVVETLKYDSEHNEAEILALGPVKCNAKCYRTKW